MSGGELTDGYDSALRIAFHGWKAIITRERLINSRLHKEICFSVDQRGPSAGIHWSERGLFGFVHCHAARAPVRTHVATLSPPSAVSLRINSPSHN